MKPFRRTTAALLLSLAWAGLAILAAGCRTPPPDYADLPGLPATPTAGSLVFEVGDQILFTFPSSELASPCSVTVKQDGTVTVPRLGTLNVAGKTPEQVQREIQEKLDKLMGLQPHYRERYFYVLGEVNRPGPSLFLGETDLVRAITAAGELTGLAATNRIVITRAGGQAQTVDYQKVLADPRRSVSVFPGDQINVPRR